MSAENPNSLNGRGLHSGGSKRSESSKHLLSERVVDPDDYNLRRRLRQLHDAREAVKTRKDEALSLERRNKKFSSEDRNRFIAEKLVDYIHELRPLLKKTAREDDFLNEEIDTVNSTRVTIELILENRGFVPETDDRHSSDGGRYIPYEASMAAWDVCNDYFEDVAGAVFEEDSASPSHNPVDPAGRFDE